jgi:amidase
MMHRCSIESLAELIAWNEDHPNSIPYGQSLLIAAEASRGLDDPAYRADRDKDIFLSRNQGIDAALAIHEADILIAPMGAAAKCTGKAGAPVVSIPVGIDCTGVAFGITLFGAVGSDASFLAIAVEIDRLIGHRLIPNI